MRTRRIIATVDDMHHAAVTPRTHAAPLAAPDRIVSLDLIRGVAALGILVMNAVSFGLSDAAYVNLAQGGNATPLDWAFGLLARVFIDEKLMAMFSLLFGIGIVVFVERAEAKGRRAIWLSLWRNLLLLMIGIAHTIIWDGDVLTLYAICAPFVLLLRKLAPPALLALGAALAVGPAVWGMLLTDLSAEDVAEAWFVDGSTLSDTVGIILMLSVFGRALGLMLIGVALYRVGVVQGRVSGATLRRLMWWGWGIGLPLSTAGLIVHMATDWSASSSLVGFSLSTLGTAPLAIAYVALIVRWSSASDAGPRWLSKQRLQNVGRMALTNYLTQTLLGVVVLTTLLGDVTLTRTMIAGFVVAVWALQLAWSTWWLEHFRFGPVEWLWRSCTYRSMQPLRR